MDEHSPGASPGPRRHLPGTADRNAGGPGGGRNSVEIVDVHKSFGSFSVLSGLTLDFIDGAITTILGPSGTGKSVLLQHMVGLLEPDKGMIRVFGEDIWDLSERQRAKLRKRFGVLFQDGALFGSMNLYDNVAFPLRRNTDMEEDQIHELVMRRLGEVGLTAAAKKVPSEVSGGMKKRAGFARALISEPEIVLFDEPDSGLDPVRTSLLCDLILEMHAEHGGTYVMVTHDISTARKVSDYVGVVWQGKLLHYSSAKEAFEADHEFVRQFLAGASSGPLGMD
jgi:phospholipid/cholesterol/gamma-HCH transport system ATP-binding protein